MSNDEQPNEKAIKPEEKADETSNDASSQSDQNSSGITKALHKPLSVPSEDSLALRAENIRSEYEKLKNSKKLAVSGVSAAFSDLLSIKPSKAQCSESEATEANSDKVSTTDSTESKSDQ